jgi:hypothetical protein
MSYFNGKLFVGGQITDFTPHQDVLMWDDTAWVQVGDGLYTLGFNWVNAMEEYQGKLYVGGSLWMADGYPGQHLITWNGSDWEGFFTDRLTCKNSVNDFAVIDGRLYMAGAFHLTGDDCYYHLLQFDGTSLCAVGRDIEMEAGYYGRQVTGNSSEIYFTSRDTILSGVDIRNLAKWVLANGADTCIQVVNSVHENGDNNVRMSATYDPSTNTLALALPDRAWNGEVVLRVHSSDGRLIVEQPLWFIAGNSRLLLPAIANGHYSGRCGALGSFTFVKY